MTKAILYSKYLFPIEIERGELGYVSRCPTFDVCSQGTTKDEAHRMISEAVQLFVEDAFDAGTLKELLKECGVDEEFEVNGIELLKQNAHCIEIYIPKGYSNETYAVQPSKRSLDYEHAQRATEYSRFRP